MTDIATETPGSPRGDAWAPPFKSESGPEAHPPGAARPAGAAR